MRTILPGLFLLIFCNVSSGIELRKDDYIDFDLSGRLIASSGKTKKTYDQIKRIDFGQGPSGESQSLALLGMEILNANLASGKTVTFPDKPDEIITFLIDYAKKEQEKICKDIKAKDAFNKRIQEILQELERKKTEVKPICTKLKGSEDNITDILNLLDNLNEKELSAIRTNNNTPVTTPTPRINR